MNDITVANAEKLQEVYNLLNQAVSVLLTIPPDQNVKSLESKNVETALQSLQVSLHIRTR